MSTEHVTSYNMKIVDRDTNRVSSVCVCEYVFDNLLISEGILEENPMRLETKLSESLRLKYIKVSSVIPNSLENDSFLHVLT